MLDTGSEPNIIKENFVKGKTVNYNNILKLNDINKYSVYTLHGKKNVSATANFD